MSIESGGYFGSNSAEEQPMPIRRYHLDRCEPVMDRDDSDGEYCLWDDVQGEITRLEQKLEEIMQDLQSRNIHLLSKHCWCEPEGHPWTQKGEVL